MPKEESVIDPAKPLPSGVTDHAVVDVLKSRLATGSRPGARTDSARVALVIEGGGMRGVVSAGMVAALEQFDALDAFDDIYGSSAGSFNGAYLISRRARLGTTIYYEDVNNRNFIDLRRQLRGQPILCLDFMLDVIAERVKPLDWEGILESPVRLHPIATSLERQQSLELQYSTKAELKLALKASAAIPWVAGPPIELHGERWWDASATGNGSIPFRIAIDDGATHVLALTTRPEGVLRGRPSAVERHFMSRQIRKEEPLLVAHYLRRAPDYARDVEELRRASKIGADGPPHIYAVRLDEGVPPVSQLETDRDKLYAGAVAGFRSAFRLFRAQEPTIVGHELGGFFF